jgi:hypothetical protein
MQIPGFGVKTRISPKPWQGDIAPRRPSLSAPAVATPGPRPRRAPIVILSNAKDLPTPTAFNLKARPRSPWRPQVRGAPPIGGPRVASRRRWFSLGCKSQDSGSKQGLSPRALEGRHCSAPSKSKRARRGDPRVAAPPRNLSSPRRARFARPPPTIAAAVRRVARRSCAATEPTRARWRSSRQSFLRR